MICTDTGVEGYIKAAVAVPEEEEYTKQLRVRQINFAQNVNIREYPSTESSVVGRVPINTILLPISEEYNEDGELWYRIEYEGTEGFIRESTVDVIEVPKVAETQAEAEELNTPEEAQEQSTEKPLVVENATQRVTQNTVQASNKNESNEVAKEEEADEKMLQPTITTRPDAGFVDEVTIVIVIGIFVSLLLAGIAMIMIHKERKKLQEKKQGKKGKSKYRIDRKG